MERSSLKNRGRELFSTTRKNGEESINRVTRYDIFIINHNASTHDPSEVLKEHSTRKRESRRSASIIFKLIERPPLCVLPFYLKKQKNGSWRSLDLAIWVRNEIRGYHDRSVIGDDPEKAFQKQEAVFGWSHRKLSKSVLPKRTTTIQEGSN